LCRTHFDQTTNANGNAVAGTAGRAGMLGRKAGRRRSVGAHAASSGGRCGNAQRAQQAKLGDLRSRFHAQKLAQLKADPAAPPPSKQPREPGGGVGARRCAASLMQRSDVGLLHPSCSLACPGRPSLAFPLWPSARGSERLPSARGLTTDSSSAEEAEILDAYSKAIISVRCRAVRACAPAWRCGPRCVCAVVVDARTSQVVDKVGSSVVAIGVQSERGESAGSGGRPRNSQPGMFLPPCAPCLSCLVF